MTNVTSCSAFDAGRRDSPRWVLRGVAAAFGLTMVATSYHMVRSNQEVANGLDMVDMLPPGPVRLSSVPSLVYPIAAPDLRGMLRKVEPLSAGMSASLCLHTLAAQGLHAEFPGKRPSSSEGLLELFTDEDAGREFFGAPALVKTRNGLRAAMYVNDGRSKESHYDQTLGCFAQLSLPLTTPIRVGGESLSLRDMLRDSIACFDPHQLELEWTAIAYASYLPPNQNWVNKFGEHYDFNALLEELLSRDLGGASCCGCHLVDAMLLLERVDSEVGVALSSGHRDRLRERNREFVSAAMNSQAVDGAWGPDWHLGAVSSACGPGEAPLSSRMLATSHVAHWMLGLPAERRVPEAVVRRALDWLRVHLQEASPDFVRDNFCPCSHAAWVLRDVGRADASSFTSIYPGSSSAGLAGVPGLRSRPGLGEDAEAVNLSEMEAGSHGSRPLRPLGLER